MSGLRKGLSAEQSITVDKEHTASHFGSGRRTFIRAPLIRPSLFPGIHPL